MARATYCMTPGSIRSYRRGPLLDVGLLAVARPDDLPEGLAERPTLVARRVREVAGDAGVLQPDHRLGDARRVGLAARPLHGGGDQVDVVVRRRGEEGRPLLGRRLVRR